MEPEFRHKLYYVLARENVIWSWSRSRRYSSSSRLRLQISKKSALALAPQHGFTSLTFSCSWCLYLFHFDSTLLTSILLRFLLGLRSRYIFMALASPLRLHGFGSSSDLKKVHILICKQNFKVFY